MGTEIRIVMIAVGLQLLSERLPGWAHHVARFGPCDDTDERNARRCADLARRRIPARHREHSDVQGLNGAEPLRPGEHDRSTQALQGAAPQRTLFVAR